MTIWFNGLWSKTWECFGDGVDCTGYPLDYYEMNTRAPALLTMGQRQSIDKVATIECSE